MRKIILVFCCLILLGTAACGTNGIPSGTPSPSGKAAESASTSGQGDTATQKTEPAAAAPSGMPKDVSFTTGLPSKKEYKPVGVMIENADGARPQTGLQAADIVYEVLAEGGITRFFCIFNDNMPKALGPVRSARIYFIHIQQEWDSIFVHYGGPAKSGTESDVYGPTTRHIKIRINGLKGNASKYFWRIDSKPSPHNVLTDLTKIQALYNYTPKPRNPWIFKADTAYKPGEAFVKKFSLPFISSSSNFVSYAYDKGKDVFKRYMVGKAFTDTTTKKAIEVKNVIVQYVSWRDLDEGKGRIMVDVTGSGKAEFFVGGKHITGTWERKDLNSQTVYKDDTGAEVSLRPGNTWIEMQPKSKSITVELEGA